MPRITAKLLAKRWGLQANHVLYRETGDWYHGLEKFPGAFLDARGYVLFPTEKAYLSCSHLSIGPKGDVGVPNGISLIPGYVRVVE